MRATTLDRDLSTNDLLRLLTDLSERLDDEDNDERADDERDASRERLRAGLRDLSLRELRGQLSTASQQELDDLLTADLTRTSR